MNVYQLLKVMCLVFMCVQGMSDVFGMNATEALKQSSHRRIRKIVDKENQQGLKNKHAVEILPAVENLMDAEGELLRHLSVLTEKTNEQKNVSLKNKTRSSKPNSTKSKPINYLQAPIDWEAYKLADRMIVIDDGPYEDFLIDVEYCNNCYLAKTAGRSQYCEPHALQAGTVQPTPRMTFQEKYTWAQQILAEQRSKIVARNDKDEKLPEAPEQVPLADITNTHEKPEEQKEDSQPKITKFFKQALVKCKDKNKENNT